MKCDKQNFLSLWTIFCPFTSPLPLPPTNLKKGLEISFYTWVPRTKNDNHRMYGSWDMKHDGHNFLSFWTIFCPFTPLKAQKIKILKKWKKYLQILSFYTSVPKIIIWYIPPQIWCMTDVIVIFQFGLLFAQKTKNEKKWKKTTGDIIILHMCTKNYDYMIYSSWDMVCDRWMDRQKILFLKR